eukprot:m51a1_g13369 hypothetical protein (102) ;mRNA; f:830-1302
MSDQWTNGLFSCANFGNCAYAFFCGSCAFASARTRYDSSNWCLNLTFLTPPLTRNIIREGYGIEGNCCTDVLISCCCAPCTAAQLLNEVDSRGPVTSQMKK